MITDVKGGSSVKEGLRERKWRETRERIAETGLKLFLENGYHATTLDALADAAGVSRRTIFGYFKSKDEIVLAFQASAWNAVCTDLLTVSPDEAPLDAVRKTLVHHAAQYASEQMRALDKLMRASETLIARKQAGYAMQEEALYATLCEIWRQPERRRTLRIVAMMSIGAMRLALDAWREGGCEGSPSTYLEETFAQLKSAI